MKRQISVFKGNRSEHWKEDQDFAELLSLCEDSQKDFNEEWISDELWAVFNLGLSRVFLDLLGKKVDNKQSSSIAWAIGITDEEPPSYPVGMRVDRGREDPPDVDSDIQDSRRDEVKDYLVRQYRHVASIATYTEFKDKGVIRDVARVFNVPLDDVSKVTKVLDTWEEFEFGKPAAWFRQKYPEVVEYGRQLRGRVRSTGVHAAGVVASKVPLSTVVPMETRKEHGGGDRIPVVGIDMNEAERVGLIKIDALGLKTLGVISDTLKSIEERHNKKISLSKIPLDDEGVYKMLSQGHTPGVFQAEAAPYTNLLIKMGVHSFDDLAASNALVRPGAMNTIGKTFISRKHGEEMIRSLHPIYDEITKDTYGVVVYQEQVMLLCKDLAGMSWGDANRVRKIIGKKKDVSEFDAYKDKFITGASQHIDREDAEQLWHNFEAHAGYSFNKSHAVAYSTVTYWTAWLKHHYPLDFMFSVLKNEKDKDQRSDYLIEIKRMGIEIRLPHVNESHVDERIETGGIRMGLGAIKYVSGTIANRYIEAGPFSSYEEVKEFTFTKGSGVNSRALEYMNMVGAVTFKDNPANMEDIKENLYEVLSLPEFASSTPPVWRRKLTNAVDFEADKTFILLGMVRGIKRGKGWSRIEIIDKTGSCAAFDKQDTEIETGKVYAIAVSNNRIVKAVPMDDFEDYNDSLVKYLSYRKMPFDAGEYYVVAFNSRITKANKKMAALLLANDLGELASVVVWNTQYGDAYINLEEGKYYRIILGQTRKGELVYKGVQK